MSVRRILPRESADEGQEYRNQAARLASDLRKGELDGVQVDLTHPALPVGEWEALKSWYVWGEPPNNAGIVFPREASCGLKRLREEKMMPDTPAVFARPGDRISIESVEIMETAAPFDHAHDKQVRLASLRIERPTGEVLHPPGPLAFYGTRRIQKHGSREAFDHIVSRILSHAGVEGFAPRSIGDEVRPFWERPTEEIALFVAEQAHRSFFDLASNLPPDGEGGMERAHLRSVANNAALAGFLLAKMEARKAEKAGAGVMRNRAKATAAVTRVDWHAKAKALWTEHPDWTLNRVATFIADEDGVAETRSVARSIQKAGLIPATSPSHKGRKSDTP